jgi:hypothetical protein
MQADAGFLNRVQGGRPAGRLLTQAALPLAQAFRMEAGPLRNTVAVEYPNRQSQ